MNQIVGSWEVGSRVGRAFLNACTVCYEMEVVNLCDIRETKLYTHTKRSVNNEQWMWVTLSHLDYDAQGWRFVADTTPSLSWWNLPQTPIFLFFSHICHHIPEDEGIRILNTIFLSFPSTNMHAFHIFPTLSRNIPHENERDSKFGHAVPRPLNLNIHSVKRPLIQLQKYVFFFSAFKYYYTYILSTDNFSQSFVVENFVVNLWNDGGNNIRLE